MWARASSPVQLSTFRSNAHGQRCSFQSPIKNRKSQNRPSKHPKIDGMPTHPILAHARTTGSALKNWFVAQCYDALGVAALWLVGLWIIGVPFAPFWAFLGGAFQFVPQVGAILGLIGPALALLLVDNGPHWEQYIELLILYAAIAVIDGLW